MSLVFHVTNEIFESDSTLKIMVRYKYINFDVFKTFLE